ncbi:hypothetical protein ES703_14517 [subsurface metagenome]
MGITTLSGSNPPLNETNADAIVTNITAAVNAMPAMKNASARESERAIGIPDAYAIAKNIAPVSEKIMKLTSAEAAMFFRSTSCPLSLGSNVPR